MPIAPLFLDSSGSSLDDMDHPPPVSSAALEAYEKKLEKWYTDDSNVKVVICQTVVEIRSQIAKFPTARDMWNYLVRRYCDSSQAQLYTHYQTLSGLQQGDDTTDQFYSQYCGVWCQINALRPVAYLVVVAHSLTCTHTCALLRRHKETQRMYEFIVHLRLKFE